MSKNAANKRRAKARHRDQWSVAPLGTPFGYFVHGVVPPQTALMDVVFASKPKLSALEGDYSFGDDLDWFGEING